ncbi:MAG: peptide chain release factor 2 [Candidatus Omnitrophota bacterium]
MEDFSKKIGVIEDSLSNFRDFLDIDKKRKSVGELQLKMAGKDFWSDPKASALVIEELKRLKSDIESWDVLNKKANELKELISFADPSYEGEIVKELKELESGCTILRVKSLFSEKFDNENAILEINSGAGGTEACDWANMIFRMYIRWAEDKKFESKVLNEVKGEEAGVKNITFLIQGLRAFGFLRSESGVHRLVRISPFDANKRRHTSFASVDVIPEIKDDIGIDIRPEDLKIETFRASGAGGQHVNVTDSAVRITHLPSGIVSSCQNERSQHQNKHIALRIIKAKLYEIKERRKQQEIDDLSGKKQRIEWGSQIRSYVLHPYLMVKDHRTALEIHNAKAVLDGKIDDFIYAYLELQKKNKPR